jgi:hypothetical protein
MYKLVMAVGLLLALAASGCASYQIVASADGGHAWIVETRGLDRMRPTVYECCTTCGEDGQGRCWEVDVRTKRVITPNPAPEP